MGMPVTTYTVLRAIADGTADATIWQALNPYNLFAFIVHDPHRHPSFHKYLRERFDTLDYLTGENLLFFALVKPPGNWMRHAGGRQYFQKLLHWRPTETTTENDSSSAISIATNLGIPVEALPCVVVSADLKANEFLWFRTSENELEDRLRDLGYIAARHDRTSAMKAVEDRISLLGQSGTESLQTSLARTLADILSFIASTENTPVRVQATEHAKRMLKTLYSSIHELKKGMAEIGADSYESSEMEEFEKVCFKTLTLASSQIEAPSTDWSLVSFPDLPSAFVEPSASVEDSLVEPPPSLESLDTPILEEDTVIILRTALTFYDWLSTNQPIEGVEFTPFVICLSKVFEREVNLSVVHWIRKELGISLPLYFNKPQPSFRAALLPTVVPNPRQIDFNRARAQKWVAPGIGESELAARTLGLTKIPEFWDTATWTLLLDEWPIITRNRNRAAHTEVIKQNSANEIRQALRRLAAAGLFSAFYRLKCCYRGDENAFDGVEDIPF